MIDHVRKNRGRVLVLAVLATVSCRDSSREPGYTHPMDFVRYTDLLRRAAESTSPNTLASALRRLEAFHEAQGSTASERLAPGLTHEQIDALMAPLGTSLPRDLVALYEWHNGVSGGCDDFAGPALLGYHCLLSLEEAIAARREVRRWLDMPPEWLPILYFQEEFFYVVLTEEQAAALPVFHRLAEDVDRVVFVNVESMIETFLEAAEAQAWDPEDPGIWRGDVFEEIRSRRNPGTDPLWAG